MGEGEEGVLVQETKEEAKDSLHLGQVSCSGRMDVVLVFENKKRTRVGSLAQHFGLFFRPHTMP